MPTGEIVYQYVLTNKNGMSVTLIDYGATITSIMLPDKRVIINNVV